MSDNIPAEQRLLAALDAVLKQSDDGTATLEALLPHASHVLGRPIPLKQLERILNKYPARYRQNDAGRWGLVQRRNRASDEQETVVSSAPPLLTSSFGTIHSGSYVVFDLETMGNWNGPGHSEQGDDIELLQVAAQRYERYLPVGDAFMSFVKPDRPIPARITHLTRISMEQVLHAPDAPPVLDAFFSYVGDLPLIAHNGAMFDGPVLQTIAARIGYALPSTLLVLDTLPLARMLLPLGIPGPIDHAPLENYKLRTLARFFGCEEEGAHRADIDVLMLGNVVRALLGELSPAIHVPHSCVYHQEVTPFLLALLEKTADPWLMLLNPQTTVGERQSLDLATLFSLFGKHAVPLLPEGQTGKGPGPGPEAIEEILCSYEVHGRDRRMPQARLAQLGGQAMSENLVAVVEASTGTGKGLGYLAPAYLQAKATGRPVVISTFTRVLQNQLYEDDLQFLSEVVDGQLTTALLKGQRNYLSSRCLAEELQDAFDEASLSAARAWGLMSLISFALYSLDGDLSAIYSIFSGIEQLVTAHQHIYMRSDMHNSSTGELMQGSDVWNLLERVRVTSEVPQAPWPTGLPRPHEQLDFSRRAKENAQRADIVVVNHSLLLLKALKGQNDKSAIEELEEASAHETGLFSPYLICDEAHTLEDAATSVLTRTVAFKHLRRVLSAAFGVHGLQHGPYGGLIRVCKGLGISDDDPTLEHAYRLSVQLISQVEALGQQLRRFIERNVVVKREDRLRYGINIQLTRQSLMGAGGPSLRQAGQQFVTMLLELQSLIDDFAAPIARQSYFSTSSVLSRHAARAERTRLAVAEELRELVQDAYWYWNFFDDNTSVRIVQFEPGETDTATWILSGMPIAVGALLYECVWSKIQSAIITSATLTSDGDGFRFFLERTGLTRLPAERLLTEALPPVFDYRSHALFLMPNHLPTPRDTALRAAYPAAVAAELRRFIPFVGGRTLGLFTARSRMELVHEQIVGELDKLDLSVLTQNESDAIERFRGEEQVSLLGVRSLWEGVNIPGPSLSYVLIEKFPFPSLGDPLEAARMNAVERAGGDGFYDYLLPRAMFLFKQGFGRLNRSSTDHGVVIMLDKRLRHAMYRGEVLTSLPNPTIGYESDLAMYQRIAEWMKFSFDPQSLPPAPHDALQELLQANQFPTNIVNETDWTEVALPSIERVLHGIWGNRNLHPFQQETLQAILTGHDVLTLAPTGSGKSLTYQIPALLRNGCTLVISPLIALIRDQVTTLRDQYGLSMVNCLVSGMSSVEQEEVLSDALVGKVKLLYLSPERLRDPRFRAILTRLPLVQLVIDEAHCISTWGHDFRPDFLEIPQLLEATGSHRIPVHALTATATPEVQTEIMKSLRFPLSDWAAYGYPQPRIFLNSHMRQNLVYRLYHARNAAESEERTIEIVRQLVGNKEQGGPGIVYVATRAKAERLAERLRTSNITAHAYHGGLPTAERHTIQELFMDGNIDVICCTNAFGMGVDKQDIRFVLHYDHPSSIEAYAQETGRAGRDGKPAYAILLYTSATQQTHRLIARKGLQKSENVVALMNVLSEMRAASSHTHRYILTSFEALSKLLKIEEASLRVLLHGAEQVGLLRRGPDVVLEAGLLISGNLSALVARLPDVHQQVVTIQLLNHLVNQKMPIQQIDGSYTLNNIRVQYNAYTWVEAGGDPEDATTLLQQLSDLEPEQIIFRPYMRGILINMCSVSEDEREEALMHLSDYFSQRYVHFDERLQAILRYVHLPADQCRRAFLENYLSGQMNAPVCGMCDHCTPNYKLPWNDLLVEANIRHQPGTQQDHRSDILLMILEALRDHNGMFSLNTLVKMLLGQAFGRTSNGSPYQISGSAHSSDHFGALKQYSIKEVRLREEINQLVAYGYVGIETRQRRGQKQEEVNSPDNMHVYQVLVLTEKGRDILAGERNLSFTQV